MFTYFTILENPSAIYFVLAMPSTMLLYFLLTLFGSPGAGFGGGGVPGEP